MRAGKKPRSYTVYGLIFGFITLAGLNLADGPKFHRTQPRYKFITTGYLLTKTGYQFENLNVEENSAILLNSELLQESRNHGLFTERRGQSIADSLMHAIDKEPSDRVITVEEVLEYCGCD